MGARFFNPAVPEDGIQVCHIGSAPDFFGVVHLDNTGNNALISDMAQKRALGLPTLERWRYPCVLDDEWGFSVIRARGAPTYSSPSHKIVELEEPFVNRVLCFRRNAVIRGLKRPDFHVRSVAKYGTVKTCALSLVGCQP